MNDVGNLNLFRLQMGREEERDTALRRDIEWIGLVNLQTVHGQ